MQTERMPVDGIQIQGRKRDARPEKVAELADSMRGPLGLRTPITVRIVAEHTDSDGRITCDVPILVAGLHRLLAARQLGWEDIDAFVMNGDDPDEVELWEIEENLKRADLTAQERADQTARWVELTGSKVGQSDPLCAKTGRGNEGGLRAAVRDLGIDRSEARRAVKIASLSPEAKEAARTVGLDDNQTALLAAASHASAPAQVAHIELEARKRQEAAAIREEERRRLRDAEDVHKLNQQQDKAIRLTVEQEFAEWLLRHVDPSEVDTLISWLQVAKNAGVIAALRREAA